MEKQGFRKNLIDIEPYVAGEQPKSDKIVKLNANENAYPPSPEVQRAIAGFDSSVLRKYPDFSAEPLKSTLAEYYGLKPSQVFVGNGSDDVLAAAFRAFFNGTEPILYPDVTYSFYPVWCDIMKIPFETVPLKDDFTIDVNDYKRPNGGIIFPNPNAPTSIALDKESITELLDANRDSVVVIDETYIDFGGESCLPLIEKYDNLLVIQTFSKSRSMAGMRIGFAMGCEKLIKYMNDVKFSINSYTMNTVTQLCGAAAVRDEKYFRETVQKIIDTREYSKKKLSELGFVFPDSMSNFIFASPQKKSAEYVFTELKKRRIFVRWWNKPIIKDYLRISIGTPDEMNSLFAALEEIING